MGIDKGFLVVQLRRKCPRCPGMMVAMYPDKWGQLHYVCELCEHAEDRDPPKGVKVIKWYKEEEDGRT